MTNGLTEGERWTRSALLELRSAGYSPAAWGRFLAAAHARAGASRRDRPALARQARLWVAIGVGPWVAMILSAHWRSISAPCNRSAVGLKGLAWWLLCGLMLDWHLGMVETEEGSPRALGPADAMTLARAWLVPLAWERPGPAICLAAAATDGLDGALARGVGEPTRAGRDLEGVVDTAFAAAAVRGAVRQGWLSRSAGGAEAARLGAGAAYSAAVWFGRAEAPDRSVVSAARATTPVRLAGLVAAGMGWRRVAGGLVWAGALASTAAVAAALRRS